MTLFRSAWTVAVLLASASVGAYAHRPIKISYIFSPDLSNPKAPKLHVRLEFTGSVIGTSTIVFPTTWAGQANLYESISNFAVLPPAIIVGQADSKAAKTIRYPSHHQVTVTYDLVEDWQGSLRHPQEFRAVLRPSNIIFSGQNGLLSPDLSQTDEVQAVFKWTNLPKEWIIASSFGTDRTKARFRGQWRRVHDALFAAGDFRLTSLNSGGEHLVLAARGTWIFSDGEAAQKIMGLCHVEREFWKETQTNDFLVVLTSYDQDLGSSDGTAFTNSFLLYLSKKQTLGVDIQSQLAHEVFHTWNPYRMGERVGDETEWFTEGFTSYYQDRILLRAGLIGLHEYLDRLNKIISAYWVSPVRNWSQTQWLGRSPTSKEESELPYRRGAVIALWLDERIRQSSGNKKALDDNMRASLGSERLTTDSLIDSLSKGLTHEHKEQLRSFINDGATIPMPTQLESSCATLIQTGSTPTYVPDNNVECDQSKSNPQ